MKKNDVPPSAKEENRMRAMCLQIWADYQKMVVDYETLSIEKYSREYNVSKFPKNLIAPLLLKRTEPTEEDAKNLRIEINRWHTSKRNPDKEAVKESALEEQTAIAILKKKGYRVMKKTTAYIDL